MGVKRIGDGQGWSFLHGKWSDGPGGEVVPPDGADVEYLAVKHDEECADFAAEFRFKFCSIYGGARFLFRVQDSRRFYALDIPWCGQQSRARHFWAGIVMADGTALQRYLTFNLVPGLCAQVERWYEARVEAKGPRLRAWIDGKPVADVEDSTYASGRLGLCSIVTVTLQGSRFAGLEVEGTPASPSEWPGLETPRPHWITPCPEVAPDTFQSYANLIQSKSGAVTLFLTFGNPNLVETRRSAYLRSSDGGRTWGAPEPATLQQAHVPPCQGANFVRRDGTWVWIFANHPILKALLYRYESHDEGRTWATPKALNVQGEWPQGWASLVPWSPVRMRDGALVLPVLAGFEAPREVKAAYMNMWTCFALRSEDDGETWSAPVRCDNHNTHPGEPIEPGTMYHGLAGFVCELGLAEARHDVLLGIGRPMRDPYMWQIQSNDGGRTWEPAAIGPFPGYCPSLTSTDSGALVATTRFPYFAAHLSRDGGRTWEPPVIVDYASWANQVAVEAEPDVVLVTYMGHCVVPGQADSRIARLRVTNEGLRLDH